MRLSSASSREINLSQIRNSGKTAWKINLCLKVNEWKFKNYKNFEKSENVQTELKRSEFQEPKHALSTTF